MLDGFIIGVVFSIAISYCLKIVRRVIAVRDQQIDEHRRVLDKTIVITIEKENGKIFAYNHKNGEFLAQGTSYEEMLAAFQARFPNTVGLIFDPTSTSIREISTITNKEWLHFDKKFKLSNVK